jgi:hypothetical protein
MKSTFSVILSTFSVILSTLSVILSTFLSFCRHFCHSVDIFVILSTFSVILATFLVILSTFWRSVIWMSTSERCGKRRCGNADNKRKRQQIFTRVENGRPKTLVPRQQIFLLPRLPLDIGIRSTHLSGIRWKFVVFSVFLTSDFQVMRIYMQYLLYHNLQIIGLKPIM